MDTERFGFGATAVSAHDGRRLEGRLSAGGGSDTAEKKIPAGVQEAQGATATGTDKFQAMVVEFAAGAAVETGRFGFEDECGAFGHRAGRQSGERELQRFGDSAGEQADLQPNFLQPGPAAPRSEGRELAQERLADGGFVHRLLGSGAHDEAVETGGSVDGGVDGLLKTVAGDCDAEVGPGAATACLPLINC